MGQGSGLEELGRFRQPVPRPASARRVATGSEQAGFVAVARELGYEAWRVALARVTLVERAFGEASGIFGTSGSSGSSGASGASGPGPGAAVLIPILGGRVSGGSALLEDALQTGPERAGRAGAGEGDAASVVLIRRSHGMRLNPGEIAFPGGRIEPGESPLQAALRETEEEIALDRTCLEVLGALPPVHRMSSGESIVAFAAAVSGSPTLKANPSEVDAIVCMSLGVLGDPSRYFEEEWELPAGALHRRNMSFFDLGEDLLWGATARILVALLDRLAAAARD
ncbi:MAG: NUDIX hydrolase [Acidimicrobiales bacterium]